MSNFVGRFNLNGMPPPEQWKKQVQSLADAAHIEVGSAAHVGNEITVQCRLSGDKGDPAAVAQAFFEQAAVALTGTTPGGPAVSLRSVEIVPPPRPYARRAFEYLRRGNWVGVMMPLVAFGGSALFSLLLRRDDSFVIPMWGLILGGVGCASAAGFGGWMLHQLLRGPRRRAGSVFPAVGFLDDEPRAAAPDEDPRQRRRIEDAKRALRLGASRMRMDADRLWRRSERVGRTAVGVFILALGGPAIPAYLLLNSHPSEWYFMFGGFGLAAVPLLIGTAMLRHEAKLREQYREVSREVANLERLDLALEYARIESEPNTIHATALDQVVAALLVAPQAGASPASPPVAQVSGKDAEDDSNGAIVKVLEATLNALTKKGS